MSPVSSRRMCRLPAVLSLLLGLSLTLGGCATTGSVSATDESQGADLACALPTRCVNSLPGSGLLPLRFEGTAPEAIAALKTTLAAFPEARIEKTGPLSLEAVFTTRLGFQDRVTFRIDTTRQRIDFRSRSLLGLYDLGKNRSRMEAFAERFAQDHPR